MLTKHSTTDMIQVHPIGYFGNNFTYFTYVKSLCEHKANQQWSTIFGIFCPSDINDATPC